MPRDDSVGKSIPVEEVDQEVYVEHIPDESLPPADGDGTELQEQQSEQMSEEDMQQNEIWLTGLREKAGLPELRNLPDGLPVDRNALSRVAEGIADGSEAKAVRNLIVTYRAWADAYREILAENLCSKDLKEENT